MGDLTLDLGSFLGFVALGPLVALSFVAFYVWLDKFLPTSTSIIVVIGVAVSAFCLMG